MLVICLLVSSGAVFALDPSKSVFQFNCQNWSRQNGLPPQKIAVITQTQDGYLWFGTQNGLLRFDGLEFKAVPIDLAQAQGQDVVCLCSSKVGGLWFGIFEGGFGYYDGGKFFPLKNDWWTRPDIGAMAMLEAHDGALWTGSGVGWGRYVEGKPAESLFGQTNINTVISFCEDPEGRVWLGTSESGLYYWAQGRFESVADPLLKAHSISALAADREGNIWVGTEAKLYCYDARGQSKPTPTVAVDIKALLVDRHGVLWIGTGDAGVVRYQHGELTSLKKMDGLVDDHVTCLFEDAEGSLWVGTQDGVSQITDLKFPIVSEREGIIPGSCRSVAASRKGGLWIAGYGASWYDGKAATNYTDPSLLSNWYLKYIFEAKNGDVYVANGEKAIDVLSGGTVSAHYPNRNWPLAFAEDDQSVLAAVGGGLFRLQNGKQQLFSFQTGRQPPFQWIRNLCVAKDGAIWVATHNGLFRVKDGDFKQWTTADGLSGNLVQYVFQDTDGAIWSGLLSGLTRVKNGQIRNIRLEDGLRDSRIFAIVPDDLGYFWMNSGHGIFRVARQNLNDFADGKSTGIQCEAFDGMESVKFTDRVDQENTGCKTSDGRIWFPSPLGVVMIDPRHFFTNAIAPPVHIQRVMVNGSELKAQGRAVLPVGARRLEFFFAALSYIAPKKVRIRYQLDGFDSSWVDAEAHRSVLYNNLKPGNYTFRVQACNADGVWNTAGEGISLALPPPFYETDWFRSLIGLTGLLGLFGLYRWKVRHMEAHQRRLQAEKDLLEAKVGKRTEELALANEALRKDIAERKRAEAELAFERELLRALLENSPDSIFFKDLQSRIVRVSRSEVAILYQTALCRDRSGCPPGDPGSFPPHLADMQRFQEYVIGKSDADFFSSDSAGEFRQDEQRIIGTGQPIVGKIEKTILSDSRTMWRLTTKVPWRNPEGKTIGILGISKDISALKEAEAKIEEAHKRLLETSRQAGMAEVATAVLHNVGNVLNSINVSAALLTEQTGKSKISYVGRVAALLQEHAGNLGEFMTRDSKGQKLPSYIAQLAEHLVAEQTAALGELAGLRKNIEHVKEIVAMQQSYAKIAGVTEVVSAIDLVEDALRMNESALVRHNVHLTREYDANLPQILADRHKVMQILINLIRNAKYACDEGGATNKQMRVRVSNGTGRIRISVIDNGVGIPPENLTRIFNHGFTTRKNGHGFGLHNGSLAAKEMGGELLVRSEGSGKGAEFTLELPVQPSGAGQNAKPSAAIPENPPA
jgi:ligand-binding sensor domain-containing protein/signal transduction histidine kinase